MLRRDFIIGLSGAAMLPGRVGMRDGEAGDPWLFAYFATGKEGQAAGLKLAASEDGFVFRTLAGGRSMLSPMVGETRLMRDPFLFRGIGKDAAWHLLWTTAWEGVTIGHATSRDLIHWSQQRAVPVMAGVAGTRNCWAPEAVYDRKARHWRIFWSSTVTGRYAETAGTSEAGYNHRLWSVTTKDFATFSSPEPLYDPGFSVIDGTFMRGPDEALYLIVKDETVTPPHKWLQLAKAESPAGPFGPLSKPFSPPWVEGPMTARIGDALVCYYDVYRDGRWGAMLTRDMVTWQDVSARLRIPAGARHGSLVRFPRALLAALES